MLETRYLTKIYNQNILAVNELSLKVDAGEIYVILGANGAGKSTTMSMLLNFIEPTSGTFSKGMRQRLGIAIAIMKNTRAVLLDEPTSGLAPKGGADFLNLLQELREEGKAIFMSTHDIFRAKQIADRIGILVEGNLQRELSREEILW